MKIFYEWLMKPEIQRTAIDDLIATIEVLIIIFIVTFIVVSIKEIKNKKRRKK